jgi:hypothetical protein
MIVRADCPSHYGRGARPEPDRNTRHNHEYRKAEAVGRQGVVTNPAEEVGVDKRLRHQRRDAHEHGHGHVDQVPADGPLCQ